MWFNSTFALPRGWLARTGHHRAAVGSGEFLGPNGERRWGLEGAAIPVFNVAWSIRLLAMGIALIA